MSYPVEPARVVPAGRRGSGWCGASADPWSSRRLPREPGASGSSGSVRPSGTPRRSEGCSPVPDPAGSPGQAGPDLRPRGQGTSAVWVERILGGATSVRKQLRTRGLPGDVERFRAEQAIWGALGAAGGGPRFARGGRPRCPGAGLSCSCSSSPRPAWCFATSTTPPGDHARAVSSPVPHHRRAPRPRRGAGRRSARSNGWSGSPTASCRLNSVAPVPTPAPARRPRSLAGVADRTGLVSLARFVDGITVAVERAHQFGDVLRPGPGRPGRPGRTIGGGGQEEIAMMVLVVRPPR